MTNIIVASTEKGEDSNIITSTARKGLILVHGSQMVVTKFVRSSGIYSFQRKSGI